MVRAGSPATRGRARGKLTGDPAIEWAGVATNFGSGPLEYLALPPGDVSIAEAVLEAAVQHRRDEQQAAADYLAGAIAQRIRAMFP